MGPGDMGGASCSPRPGRGWGTGAAPTRAPAPLAGGPAALPHPQRRSARTALRCLDDANSHTLLFVLKDTLSSPSLQKPQKIACHTQFLRADRPGSPPRSRAWGRASRRAAGAVAGIAPRAAAGW